MDDTKVSDAAYLRALAVEFEEGGAHPDKIAAALREIADHIDGGAIDG